MTTTRSDAGTTTRAAAMSGLLQVEGEHARARCALVRDHVEDVAVVGQSGDLVGGADDPLPGRAAGEQRALRRDE
ncbi:MAG: hypothetical protein ACXWJA_04400, partial [Caldimonas sp.]